MSVMSGLNRRMSVFYFLNIKSQRVYDFNLNFLVFISEDVENTLLIVHLKLFLCLILIFSFNVLYFIFEKQGEGGRKGEGGSGRERK